VELDRERNAGRGGLSHVVAFCVVRDVCNILELGKIRM
jgi:hypothetical protein